MAEEHTNEGKADRQIYLEITQGGHRCIPMRKTKTGWMERQKSGGTEGLGDVNPSKKPQ